MTAATYTFTLDVAQATAVSMNVAMRAKVGSSIPGGASRWAGDALPTATLNWPAGERVATAVVNTKGNAAVDGNVEYEWYKVSSTPSDLSFDTGSLPKVTIVDDDTATATTYGPLDTADTQYFNTESPYQEVSWTFGTGQLTADLHFGFDAAGQNGVIVGQNSDGIWISRFVRGGVATNQSPLGFAPSAGTITARLGTDGAVRLAGVGASVIFYGGMNGITPGTWARWRRTASGSRTTGVGVTIKPYSGAY